jgi:hypothetical protein
LGQRNRKIICGWGERDTVAEKDRKGNYIRGEKRDETRCDCWGR